MLWVITLPSSYGSPRALERRHHQWEEGVNLLPVGQGACGYRSANQIPTGRETEKRGGEYLELGRDGLSLAAFHLVLAARQLVPRLQSCRWALTAWPRCAGADLHAHSLRSLWAAVRPLRKGALREGGEERESWETPNPLLRLSWVIFPSPNHCIR